MRHLPLLTMLALPLAGCHSPYIQATVSNRTSEPIPLVEVDYPSASFGTENLTPGQDFRYRFKVLGSGALQLLYTGSDRREHKLAGPALKQGDEGNLQIVFDSAGPHWDLRLNTPALR